MEISVNCEICGEKFTPNGRQKKRCAKTHTKNCKNCGQEFILSSNTPATKEYCSRKCVSQDSKRINYCPVCHSQFNKRAKTCSTECANILFQRTTFEKGKKCELCAEIFHSTSSTSKYCSNNHYVQCEVCDGYFILDNKYPWKTNKTCSITCRSALINSDESNKKRRATSIHNWGTEFPSQSEKVKEKIIQSNLDKYGVIHPSKTDNFQQKRKDTCLQKYGVGSTLQVESIRNKAKRTNKVKYGHENPFGSKIIQDQIKLIMQEKYGFEHHMKNSEIVNKVVSTNMERYGVPNVLMDEKIKSKAIETFYNNINEGNVNHRRVSKLNRHYASLISENISNINISFEEKFGSFYADLGINHDKILIDINPAVSHNSQIAFGCIINGCSSVCDNHNPINKYYHYKRAISALQNDKTLIQWYDWDNKEKLIKVLSNKLQPAIKKISARKLQMKKISQKETNVFLDNYHIQGRCKGQLYCYGLFLENELIAVASFGKARFGNKSDWEFLRFAVKNGIIIHGGSGKLLNGFINEIDPKSIVSYIDFNHTTKQNTFLNSIGFMEVKATGPALIWYRISDGLKISNNTLLSLGADRLLGTSYGSIEKCGMNNSEIMIFEGFLPIWTAGNRVFIWSNLNNKNI